MTTPLVKGMPVVSLHDGSTLGMIDHVYVDPERRTVVGFTFHQGGSLFGGGASGLVDSADVHAFGPDAVTIPDVSVVRSDVAVASRRRDLLELEDLLHRPVITAGGMLVGQVAAVQFSEVSYQLTALDVLEAGTHEHRRLEAAAIQTIGEEWIIVAEPASDSTATAGQRRPPVRLVSNPATNDTNHRDLPERTAVGA
jgi:uncharacterized protein YrrD